MSNPSSACGFAQVSLCLLTAISVARADDWPHWRGPGRDDLVQEDSGWSGGRWNIREEWRVDTAAGGSAPIVVDGQLLVFGWKDKADHLTCLDAVTGKQLWDQSYPAPEHSRWAVGELPLYSGPSASPTADVENGRVYTFSADGELRCWNLRAGGELVWRKNMIESYLVARRPKVTRVSVRDYGYTAAPLLINGDLIVEVGSTQGILAAFDPATGEEKWRSQAKGPAGHSGGPVPMLLDGVPCVACYHIGGLLVMRCDEGHKGETVCEIPWLTDYAQNVAGPSVQGNAVILIADYNQARTVRYDISLTQPPQLKWEHKSGSRVCSPVIHNGRVSWGWRTFHCLDFETGAEIFTGGTLSDAESLVHTRDEKLILWSGQGNLKLIDAGPEAKEYRELASVTGLGGSDVWPHVVLANGRIYCKDRAGKLVCLGVGS